MTLPIHDNEKITVNTELNTWYGETTNGDKVAITEITLFEMLSLMAHSINETEANIGAILFEKAKSANFIEMHDGTRLAKNINELLNHDMIEIANQLIHDAKIQNRKNGYLNTDPFDLSETKDSIIV